METRVVNIFLDDIREPIEAYKYTKDNAYMDLEWVVVRSYNEFVEMLDSIINQGYKLGTVSFDHDLAEEHYQDYLQGRNFLAPDDEISLNYDAFEEKTGYDCAKHLLETCYKAILREPIIKVHSMNPVGKQNILNLFNKK